MKNIYLSFIALSLVITGCKDDFEDLEFEDWKPIIAIPLVSSEITVDDVLTELNHPEEVLILENGLVALNYKGELFSLSAESILDIPDQDFSESVALGVAEALLLDNSGTFSAPPVNYPFNIDLSPADVSVAEIKFLSGSLTMSMTRQQDEGVTGSVMVLELVDENGDSPSFDFSGTSAVGVPEEISVDLTGYKLNPLMDFSNQITLSASMVFSNNDMNTAMAGDFLSLEMSFSGLTFDHIIGDFGDLTISADTDSISIDLFENIQGGSFALTNAIFNLTVTNSFGFPSNIELGQVVSINENTGVQTPLILDDISLQGQQELGGAPEVGIFSFDNENSDVTSLFDPAPLLVVFNITAESNPDGTPPPDDLNFITSESSFDVGIDLILPLEGYALNVFVTDTIPATISFDAYEEVDSIEFKIQMDNTFPLDIAFQALILDENDIVIDSLFSENATIMESALVDSDGNVTSPSSAVNFILIKDERVTSIQNMKSVKFRSIFNSPGADNQDVIRIKETQKVDIKLGVKVFGNIEL
ncbi:MAG: hypothetical protein ACI8QW_000930 [Saprospiraceae bacterium]|jgi:hypothetical protein